jgi:hypothetical protein
MAEAIRNYPVIVEYKVDVSQFVAAMETMAKQCTDAAEAMRRFAEAHDAPIDADETAVREAIELPGEA